MNLILIGGLALLGFALFGTRKGRHAIGQDSFLDLAEDWDSFPVAQQNAIAENLVQELIRGGSKGDMVRGAIFLDGMDRPAEAVRLRTAAAMLG